MPVRCAIHGERNGQPNTGREATTSRSTINLDVRKRYELSTFGDQCMFRLQISVLEHHLRRAAMDDVPWMQVLEECQAHLDQLQPYECGPMGTVMAIERGTKQILPALRCALKTTRFLCGSAHLTRRSHRTVRMSYNLLWDILTLEASTHTSDNCDSHLLLLRRPRSRVRPQKPTTGLSAAGCLSSIPAEQIHAFPVELPYSPSF